MKNFEARFAEIILNNRIIVIFLSLLVVGLLGTGTSKLYMDGSNEAFFSDDNPELLAFHKLENTYTKHDNVIIVLAPKDGNVFTRSTLSAIENLTAASWQMPYSSRVDSITNFQYTEAVEDDLIVRDMVTDASSLSDDEVQKVKQAVLSEPILFKQLISEKGHVTGINVTLQIAPLERTVATAEIAEYTRAMKADLKASNPNIDVYLSGMVMMDDAFNTSAINDVSKLLPFSFACMMILLAVLVGRFFGTLVTFLVILFSIIAAMGVGGMLGYPLTGVSSSTPIIILTVAIANCVHVLTTYAQSLKEGQSKKEAMANSLKINLQPVFLASATTAIGFLTMNFSEVPPFNHLGTLVAIGVLLSFALSITFLPALVTLLPKSRAKFKESDGKTLLAIADFVIRKRRACLWGMTLITVFLIANLPRNELNDIFVHYFSESIDFRTDTDFMVENLTGVYTLNWSLESKGSGGISEPGFLQDTENFSLWLEQQPETIHVSRFTEIMKRLNKNMHGDDDAYYKLPDNRDLAAQYLLLYEMSLPYGLDLNNQINVDKSSTKIRATTQTISSKKVIALDKKAKAWIRENTSYVTRVDSASTVLMFSHIGQRNIKTMLIGTVIALVLISVILMLALRSLKLGALSLIPNLIPAAAGFGVWGILVGQVGLSLSVVTGMTFGIVIDYTVHFMSKYLRARREDDLSPENAIRYAFKNVGQALVITTIILVIGFGVLGTSVFAFNATMGQVTAIIISIALAAVLFLLPPLLLKIEGK
jgi:predicted RND superfamily exporter protein|tara:strand:- start:687 stop:2978 length:2292 start_codon:yes stop_codon:yes gene_type:complete